MTAQSLDPSAEREEIAIIGMAGRFPGADIVDALWRLLRDGREGLTRFEREDLRAAGLSAEVTDRPDYVAVNGRLDGVESFDAPFFRMTPREARITDPQHRAMLELAWQALEDSGYDPARYDGSIGVFAGCGPSSYLLHNLWPNRAALAGIGELPVQIGTNKDYLATRISYRLDLTGPSVCVSTACSTSLVAVHMAAQALLDYQCDMALAGGAGIQVPQDTGYLHQAGGILSPDGHCRAFDAEAQGTVGGNGAALVVLKRLSDALADGDTIHAVIRGSAINNDGGDKAGYTAPSVDGQARVVAEALAVAAVGPETIGYVEAHGTGTPLGDPIEVAALARVFGGRDRPCPIGSIKTNIGHLDEAAGVAGLIKAVLCLRHRQIPASLHFERANPEIDFAAAGLTVNRSLVDWAAPVAGHPRRAGVSSFGIGGTNAHVVLEEAPPVVPVAPSRPLQLLPVSARSAAVLSRRVRDLADWFAGGADADLADVAFTLQRGRRAFEHRGVVLAADGEEAQARLRRFAPAEGNVAAADPPPVIFLCSGQGSQYPGMGRGLYEHEPVFRMALDACAERLLPHLGLDIRRVVHPRDAASEARAADRLQATEVAQPALFAVEYATAALLRHWGVKPTALIGHSLGEYVAACLAGSLDLDTALALVAARGRLMQAAPPGAMLAVPLPADELMPLLGADLALAAVNAPDRCVASGSGPAIDALATRLEESGVPAQRLAVSHGFHSPLMEPVLVSFAAEIGRHRLAAPTLPYISNLDGDWITPERARDPQTYLRHLREPVAYAQGIARILRDHPDAILLEIGPGQALAMAARRTGASQARTLTTLPGAQARSTDHRTTLASLGALWQAGVAVDWAAFAEPRRRRVSLPGYPFERERHWIDAPKEEPEATAAAPAHPRKNSDVTRWFYAPTWRRAEAAGGPAVDPAQTWLVLTHPHGRGAEVLRALRERGARAIAALPGDAFARLEDATYSLRPDVPEDFVALLDALAREGRQPDRIVYLWSLEAESRAGEGHGFTGLALLGRALAERCGGGSVDLCTVTAGAEDVTGDEPLVPDAAAVTGAARVIGQELPGIVCRTIDLDARELADGVDRLCQELATARPDGRVALRGRYRWIHGVEPLTVTAPAAGLPPLLRREGTYLIVGGLGQLGLLLAEYLAERVAARLVLVSRTETPTAAQSRRMAAMERAGARVLHLAGTVGDPADIATIRRKAEAAFGRIDGVIHAAGLPAADTLCDLRSVDPEDAARHFAVKPHGVAALDRIFADGPPDFFLLFSSLASILGGLGFTAYAAANSMLDAAARRRQRDGAATWISVNWDAWDLEAQDRPEQSALDGRLRALSITPAEGRRVFDILFDNRFAPQVAVSTWDLQQRLTRWRSEGPADTGPEPAVMPATDPSPELEDGPGGAIADIWCRVLGLERVGPEDNFFALNGDSLLATQLIAQINRRLGTNLGVRAMFEHPTVSGLAALAAAGTDAAPAAIPPAPPAPDYPLSHGQKRLWLLCQSPEASVAYNMSYAVRLIGRLDPDALRRAFDYVVARHESLRTAFVVSGGAPRQAVREPAPFPLPLRDLSRRADPAAVAEDAARAEALAPFDLGAPPLLRAGLLKLGADDHVLLITLHHIVGDGLSLNALIRELDRAYGSLRAGDAPSLPPLTLQYRDFAVWQERQMAGPAMARHREYWMTKLQGDLPRPALPGVRNADAGRAHAGAQVVVTLSDADRDRLHRLCRAETVTLFMLLAAALKVLLHRASGEADIVIGTPVAGREQAELEGQIGHYLNNLVLRDRVTRRESFRTLLHRVAATVAEAFEHQAYPFDRLVEDLGVPVRPGETPLFGVLLNLMPSRDLELRLGNLELRPFGREAETTLFDLNVMVCDGPDGLALQFAYNSARYEAAAMHELAEGYARLLRRVAETPEIGVRDLCAALDAAGPREDGDKAKFLADALDLDEVF